MFINQVMFDISVHFMGMNLHQVFVSRADCLRNKAVIALEKNIGLQEYACILINKNAILADL